MRLSRAARGPELHTKTQNEECILLQYLYCKSGKSVRWLVLLAMEKSFRWRSERRERRRDFVYFILEKSCSQK